MGKQTEEVVNYSCDFCGEEIEDYDLFEFKGKYFCGNCRNDLKKLLKYKDE